MKSVKILLSVSSLVLLIGCMSVENKIIDNKATTLSGRNVTYKSLLLPVSAGPIKSIVSDQPISPVCELFQYNMFNVEGSDTILLAFSLQVDNSWFLQPIPIIKDNRIKLTIDSEEYLLNIDSEGLLAARIGREILDLSSEKLLAYYPHMMMYSADQFKAVYGCCFPLANYEKIVDNILQAKKIHIEYTILQFKTIIYDSQVDAIGLDELFSSDTTGMETTIGYDLSEDSIKILKDFVGNPGT